jgi:hypothetical protein
MRYMRVYVHPPKFGKYDFLLDNQADVSIVHPRMLYDVLLANLPITVKGIGGKQLKAEHTGYLQEFFRVYASEQANPSVLLVQGNICTWRGIHCTLTL